ncbi:MAG: UDP-2,3-diacylglucosamine diphosphatase [Acidihalobacter sp.]|uniref:UDP-2,3-diacylglucosamine diphosphatase n=1 Tax=Acidihalobacter sp. TaxID=1872108 RepID=UPI00307E500D
MPETLFISDLHLDLERPEVIDLLVRFLDERAVDADALYILGDLFEYWIGDDDIRDGLLPAIEALRRVSDAGVPLSFMAGNRDFLIGSGFAERAGCRLLEDPTRVELYGVPTLLMHGDSLCTDDVAYQALRKQLRDPAWQAGFLALPVEQRRAQAEALRRKSREATRGKAMAIMDVNAGEVDAAFRKHGVRRIIHGHTHRPAVHALEVDGGAARRIVLGDWYTQGSVLSVTAEGYTLEELRTN